MDSFCNTVCIYGPFRLAVGSKLMEWAERYRMWMIEKKLSQEEIGSRLDPPITQGAVGHYLTGRTPVTYTKLLELCRVAGADPQTILFGGPKEMQALQRIREVLDAHPVIETDPKTLPPRRGRGYEDQATIPGKGKKPK